MQLIVAWRYLGELLEGHHVYGCGDTFFTPTLSALRQLLKLLVTQYDETAENINWFICLASSESNKDFDSVVGEV